jgi:hypothetical protein
MQQHSSQQQAQLSNSWPQQQLQHSCICHGIIQHEAAAA